MELICEQYTAEINFCRITGCFYGVIKDYNFNDCEYSNCIFMSSDRQDLILTMQKTVKDLK